VYRIIHVDQDWIVCEGQIAIIKFDRKAAALQAVHDAKGLLHGNESVESEPIKSIAAKLPRVGEGCAGPL
jgi:hypothetical protein